ncbi:VanZ family protein [Rufibacter roseolus]|uniref:VanZ family protein n=1 Tax=Rufibacter roseolus TaxID=2817375 RepID=UPI001B3028F2|nr:VanZ family protein [Rufibacter roseolus]
MAVRSIYYALALGWAVVILVLTLLPAQALPPDPHWDIISVDSLVHAILFGVQLLLLLYGFLRDPAVLLGRRLVTIAFFSVVFFGIFVEVLQGSMGLGRQADPFDALCNTIGCFFGLGIWALVPRRL